MTLKATPERAVPLKQFDEELWRKYGESLEGHEDPELVLYYLKGKHKATYDKTAKRGWEFEEV